MLSRNIYRIWNKCIIYFIIPIKRVISPWISEQKTLNSFKMTLSNWMVDRIRVMYLLSIKY